MNKLQKVFKSAYKHYKDHKNTRDKKEHDQKETNESVHILSSIFTFDCIVEDDNIEHLIRERFEDLRDWCWDKIIRVFTTMYPDPTKMMTHVDEVFVHIYSFKGVGFTVDGPRRGSKIVHISSNYISSVLTEHRLYELDGVTCHELVHVFQYDGEHTVPHGLIEGLPIFIVCVSAYLLDTGNLP